MRGIRSSHLKTEETNSREILEPGPYRSLKIARYSPPCDRTARYIYDTYIIAHLLYPLQQLRRLEADVEPVGRLAAQLHRLQLPEPSGCLHLAVDRTGTRLPPERQGHAEMSIGPHLASCHSTP